MDPVLEFEKPIVELEAKLRELRQFRHLSVDFQDEIERLERKVDKLREDVFSRLSTWQKVLLSRHPLRPYTLDYLNSLCPGFVELHGDRRFGDDPAVVAALAELGGRRIVVVGHQKGRTTKDKIRRNFGMPLPEGYRKAVRAAHLAEQFGLPLLCLIDTPGAYPGPQAEERGQAQAIAESIMTFCSVGVPIVVVVIGEGGSGGALAIGVGDRIFMQEYATYSVISPEGCASILWRDPSHAEAAAEALRITADQIEAQGIIDGIIEEPMGGAHRDPERAAALVQAKVCEALEELCQVAPTQLIVERRARFRAIGVTDEV